MTYQGPVDYGDDEKRYRKTGVSKTKSKITNPFIQLAVHQGPVRKDTDETKYRRTGVSERRKYQGPVRPGTDEKIFRETGIAYNPNKPREDVALAIGIGAKVVKAAAKAAAKKAGGYAGRKIDSKLNQRVTSKKVFKKQQRMTVVQKVQKIKSPSSYTSVYMKDELEQDKRNFFFS